jgi:hypothetical protein
MGAGGKQQAQQKWDYYSYLTQSGHQAYQVEK